MDSPNRKGKKKKPANSKESRSPEERLAALQQQIQDAESALILCKDSDQQQRQAVEQRLESARHAAAELQKSAQELSTKFVTRTEEEKLALRTADERIAGAEEIVQAAKSGAESLAKLKERAAGTRDKLAEVRKIWELQAGLINSIQMQQRKELEGLREAHKTELETERTRQKAISDSMQKQLERIAVLKLDLVAMEELTRLRKTKEEILGETKSLEGQNDSLHTQLAPLRSKCGVAESALAKKTKEELAQTSLAPATKAASDISMEKLAKLREALREMREQIMHLESPDAEIVAKIAYYEARLKGEDEDSVGESVQVQRKHSGAAERARKTSFSDEQLREKKETLDSLKAEHTRRGKEITSLDTALTQAKIERRNRPTREKLESRRAEEPSLEPNVEALAEEAEAAKRELAALEQENRGYEKAIEAEGREIGKMEAELARGNMEVLKRSEKLAAAE